MDKSISFKGTDIDYRLTEAPSACGDILFLHGWGGNSKSFAPIESFFIKHYNCIFVSFPMFNKSDKNSPQKPYKLDDYAELVERIIEQEWSKKRLISVIAHSFGARVAVRLLSRTPGCFDKMLLTGAAGIPPRRRLSVKLKIGIYKLRRRLFKTPSHGGSEEYRVLTPAGKATFQNILKEDLSPEIAELNVPTMLIFGKKDKSTPLWMGKHWTRVCKTSKLVIYEDAGHFCFLEHPSRFIIDAQSFFNTARRKGIREN